MMDEAKLIEKLRLIEALFAGATTEGEQVAAEHARQRILTRLRSMEVEDPPVEYQFSMRDMWTRRVFVALLRRYGLRPYRYRRQRYTTVMVKVSKRFVDETLWPQFESLSETLREYLSEVTDRVVIQVINDDLSEAPVINERQALPPAGTGAAPTSTRPAATGAASTSTRPAGTGAAPTSTRPAATGAAPTSTRPAGTGAAPTSTRPAATGAAPTSTRPADARADATAPSGEIRQQGPASQRSGGGNTDSARSTRNKQKRKRRRKKRRR